MEFVVICFLYFLVNADGPPTSNCIADLIENEKSEILIDDPMWGGGFGIAEIVLNNE